MHFRDLHLKIQQIFINKTKIICFLNFYYVFTLDNICILSDEKKTR